MVMAPRLERLFDTRAMLHADDGLRRTAVNRYQIPMGGGRQPQT